MCVAGTSWARFRRPPFRSPPHRPGHHFLRGSGLPGALQCPAPTGAAHCSTGARSCPCDIVILLFTLLSLVSPNVAPLCRVLHRARKYSSVCHQGMMSIRTIIAEPSALSAVVHSPLGAALHITKYVLQDDTLEVPHPRWRERPFVTAPLSDLAASMASTCASSSSSGERSALGGRLREASALWESFGGRSAIIPCDSSSPFFRESSQEPAYKSPMAFLSETLSCSAPQPHSTIVSAS